MIKFENVSKTFKTQSVISNISFEIEKGQLVAIIGGSGCGKTTTLKMINRLIKPTAGKIYINGEDIKTKDVIELRRNMGYVIQQTGLFPHMTIRDNIEIIPKLEKKDKAEIIARTIELMEMVGLDPKTFLDRFPTELSGGQQQRIGVARAFATNPDIILMDEPFSALDPITRLGLQDELIDLQAQLSKTIVFVTHDMDEAIKIADKICIMDKGHILQYDTPENILRNPANDFVATFVGKNRIWSSPEYIKAEDIMIEDPVTCNPGFTLFKCREKMKKFKVDSLMVVNPQTKQLEGIIKGSKIREMKDQTLLARTIMDTEIESVSPDENMIEVLKRVDEITGSTLPVVDEQGKLKGLITKTSLVTTLSQQYMTEEVE
ncbi:MAG: betaine/proline/choline family ABC transporter ATP-binding protein [Cellulosilyticaceae bacterium]